MLLNKLANNTSVTERNKKIPAKDQFLAGIFLLI